MIKQIRSDIIHVGTIGFSLIVLAIENAKFLLKKHQNWMYNSRVINSLKKQ